jgi:hypothetical protein
MNTLPEHILIAARDLVDYMPPDVLAALVDSWIYIEEYHELAQIALDAWRDAGLRWPANQEPKP